jgi:hypothetical protein
LKKSSVRKPNRKSLLGDQSTEIHARNISVQKKSKRPPERSPSKLHRYDANIKGID